MSIQTSNALGQPQTISLVEASTILDRPRAVLRHAFVQVLQAHDAAVSAERDLGLWS